MDLDYKKPEDFAQIKKQLEEIKHEVFALHRRAATLISGQTFLLSDGREVVWNMVPYDVQLLGALSLHDGNISEMRTGEGKTLVATIAASLNAIAGYPVHIVTVNDYLAQRDSAEMRVIYEALGLTVGVVIHDQSPAQKQEAYRCNIVYATNNELGFDYLRDNMVGSVERRVMGPLFYAIVDEVDSILVDEARTPLIISAPDTEPTSKYLKFAQIAKVLKKGVDYKIDEKQKTATLTEEGILEIEKILGVENIYASEHYNDIHHVENALKAGAVYERDVDYLVRADEVLIIDEHTGRVLSGRRYSDGLHQAIEAKENVEIQQETKTLASITFQNYFRLYRKLAGMTGTAKTEEEEFYKIYHLEVIIIPTNRPLIRLDQSDLLFKNEKGKYEYLAGLIRELHAKGQPILVGTVSVAKSEMLSSKLEELGIPHKVLNAKQDAHEADIIAQAGQIGAITIATNMAGRGTDIKVAPEAVALTGTVSYKDNEYPLGGLFVIGTEKHETRRIDNQLRGRSGRQGDPGFTQFMIAPTDDIMRIFGGDRLSSVLNSSLAAGTPDDEPIMQSSFITNRITSVQKQVEGRNFDIRKHILEYDDVLNQHRLVMYGKRNRILEGEDIHAEVLEMFSSVAENFVRKIDFEPENLQESLAETVAAINAFAGTDVLHVDQLESIEPEELKAIVQKALLSPVDELNQKVGNESFFDFEKRLVLGSIDELWMSHIDRMSHLREEVAFEGYAQKQPLVVYKERAYDRFAELVQEIQFRVVKALVSAREVLQLAQREISEANMIVSHELPPNPTMEMPAPAVFADPQPATQSEEGIRVIRVNETPAVDPALFKNVGRNDVCPCGSGKKFKHCHGK